MKSFFAFIEMSNFRILYLADNSTPTHITHYSLQGIQILPTFVGEDNSPPYQLTRENENKRCFCGLMNKSPANSPTNAILTCYLNKKNQIHKT